MLMRFLPGLGVRNEQNVDEADSNIDFFFPSTFLMQHCSFAAKAIKWPIVWNFSVSLSHSSLLMRTT